MVVVVVGGCVCVGGASKRGQTGRDCTRLSAAAEQMQGERRVIEGKMYFAGGSLSSGVPTIMVKACGFDSWKPRPHNPSVSPPLSPLFWEAFQDKEAHSR